MTKTTWQEKLNNPSAKLPKIVVIKGKMAGRFGTKAGDRMVIAHPKEVDAIIKQVKKGKLITQGVIRDELAKKHQVNSTCPLTTGIFCRIAAEAAEEDRQAGIKLITPYWRVLKDDGSLNEKFPGGTKAQAAKLKQEGFRVEKSGKSKLRVKDFERFLVK